MRTLSWLRRAAWLGAFAFAVWTIPTVVADEPPKGKVAGEKESGDLGQAKEFVPEPLRAGRRVLQGVIHDVEPGKYTLKLSLTRVPKALDAQLQLKGEGALVASVVEGGPADEAGLKVHDIVVAAPPDTPIKTISDVIKVVNDSDGNELTFKVLREGEPITITITPAVPSVRIDADRLLRYRDRAEKAADEATRKVEVEVRELEERIRHKLKDLGVDLRMQVIRPGQFVTPRLSVTNEAEEFPEDLSVQITKSGKDPAKIEVKQGDEAWTVTEKELDELPKEVRQHVEKLLGRTRHRFIVRPQGKGYSVALPRAEREEIEELAKSARSAAKAARERAEHAAKAARGQAEEIRTRLQGRLERRLDEMTREMREMRERMEELRRGLRERAESDTDDDQEGADDKDGDDDET